MAVARCDKHSKPQETRLRYAHVHQPHPELRIVCGATLCTRPALIWLSDEEQERYLRGVRTFGVIGHHRVDWNDRACAGCLKIPRSFFYPAWS